MTERTPLYRRRIVGSCIRPEWKVRVEQVLEDITLEKQERSPRRRITNGDDISQPIIAYIEICNLQHNGRRAARAFPRLLSPLCEIFLLYLSLLAAVPVSGGVGFRQSIERIWELCR